MKYRQLTGDIRYHISLLFDEDISLTEISKRVGVSKSTVSREVRRNGTAGGYSAAGDQRLRIAITITFDNSGEFSEHRAIAKALKTETCFAHPYASHERG